MLWRIPAVSVYSFHLWRAFSSPFCHVVQHYEEHFSRWTQTTLPEVVAIWAATIWALVNGRFLTSFIICRCSLVVSFLGRPDHRLFSVLSTFFCFLITYLKVPLDGSIERRAFKRQPINVLLFRKNYNFLVTALFISYRFNARCSHLQVH